MSLEQLWRGPFGDSYTERTIGILSSDARAKFWRSLLSRVKPSSVLEVGCGSGANLRHIEADRVAGIDVNESALVIASTLPGVQVRNASALQLPFENGEFDLVFTSGLLIHIAPQDVLRVMAEVVRVSSQYVLALEYFDAQTRVIANYHGQKDALWARPYGDLYLGNFSLELRETHHLGPVQGFDDVTGALMEKR